MLNRCWSLMAVILLSACSHRALLDVRDFSWRGKPIGIGLDADRVISRDLTWLSEVNDFGRIQVGNQEQRDFTLRMRSGSIQTAQSFSAQSFVVRSEPVTPGVESSPDIAGERSSATRVGGMIDAKDVLMTVGFVYLYDFLGLPYIRQVCANVDGEILDREQTVVHVLRERHCERYLTNYYLEARAEKRNASRIQRDLSRNLFHRSLLFIRYAVASTPVVAN